MKCFAALMLVTMLIVNFSHAQHPVLYGTTNSGSEGVFRYKEENNELENIYQLKNSGIYWRSHMVPGKDGIIYGVAQGGPFGHGIIYSLDPETNKYTIRKNFREVDGATPNSALVEGKDGKLYGTTELGGHNGNGVLFSFDPATSVFRILLHFEDVSVSNAGALIYASDGILYGIATDNANFGLVVFSFDLEQNAFHTQIIFPSEFGSFPSGSLTEGAGGILYGLMNIGGSNNLGTLYSYSLSSKQLTKRFDFDGSSGSYPLGTLTLGSDAKLYSITSGGWMNESQGKIFCFNPMDNSVTSIHDFDGPNGSGQGSGLAEGEDGKLYGMSLKHVFDGSFLQFIGSIFYSINKDGTDYKVLRDFDHPGSTIQGNLITVDHKLYGIALAERTHPYEYIFSYEISQDLFTKIIRTNQDKGNEPTGSMVQATDGRFYGFANRGGAFGLGGIFSFNPGTRVYTMLLPFNENRGFSPENALVQAANGKLYGLTKEGGRGNHGVIFSYDLSNSRYVVEKSFEDAVPQAAFALGKDGKLYSTIQRDGFGGESYIFSFNPTTGKYKELSKLCCGSPKIFTPSSDGNLYASGNDGIYIFNPIVHSVDLVYYPEAAPGINATPSERLIEAADHKLYGMATEGGVDRMGLIYSFDPSTRTFAPLFSFDESTGIYPFGSLRYASDGKLYGIANEGGMNNLGTLFSFNPVTNSLKLLRHFDVLTGRPPDAIQLLELNTTIPPIISITDQKMFEGEIAELTVSLNRISMNSVALNYRTVAGTATDAATNADFIPASGQVIIPPGEISTTISVPLLEDELLENREVFTVVLEKADETPVQLGDSVGRISILNGMRPIIPAGGEIITLAPGMVTASETIVKDELVIRATPNPSSDFFTLQIAGITTDHLAVTVINLSGQIIDKFNGVLKNTDLVFGQNYPSGSYFVQMVDGKKTKVMKLIKTSK